MSIRLYAPQDMFDDPHFTAREAIIEVPHPHYGTVRMLGVFPKMSRTPGAVTRPAPARVGADNAAVYASLGIDDAEIDRMKTSGII